MNVIDHFTDNDGIIITVFETNGAYKTSFKDADSGNIFGIRTYKNIPDALSYFNELKLMLTFL